MNTIYRKVPFTNNTFDEMEEQQLEAFICPLHTQHQQKLFPGQKTRRTRNLQRFGKFVTQHQKIRKDSETEEENEEINPTTFFTQMQQKPWFTVIPLGVVRPEEVKVKLNPLCRLLVIKATPLMQRNYMSRTCTKQIHRIVTLPKNIRMEKLQVKLTPRGELVVVAPFKFMTGQETQMTPFTEQGCDLSTLKWITIPIINYRETIRNKKRQQPFFPFQGESSSESSSGESTDSETETSESETETETETSSSETETEDENIWQPKKNRNIRTTIKFQVQKYVQLLQKIFYPNVVVAKIIRGENTTITTPQQLQVALDVKFVDFRAEDIKVRMHETRRMLTVEAKKVRQFQEPQFGTTVKYVRREFELPQWLDVKKVVYRVLPTGVLRIKLPLLTNITASTFQHSSTLQTTQQHQKMGCQGCLYNFNVVKRCPEYKKYKKPARFSY